jgi:hypothetical protein
MVDILGKCALSRGISWANVQYRGGYLGQMCFITRDILGKYAIPWWISWANVLYHEGYLGQMCITIMDKLVRLFINYIAKERHHKVSGYLFVLS